MKVLVTGANGFIGREIVFELFKSSHEIFAIGRSENVNKDYVKAENYFKADISNKNIQEVVDTVPKVQTVIHCAGLAHQFGKVEKEDFWRANVVGTRNIANLAIDLKAEHFVLISSVSVYGGNLPENLSVEESFDCYPRDFYAESKLESERVAENILSKKGIKLTILRPATVIGEGDRGNFLRLIQAIDGKRFVWIGEGSNYKSLIHKNDVARACLCIIDKMNYEKQIFNVSGIPLTIKEIVMCIERGLNKSVPAVSIPLPLLKKLFALNSRSFGLKKILKLEETVNKWVAEDVYSGEKLRKTYGFEAKISVEDAIMREVKWYLSDKLSKK